MRIRPSFRLSLATASAVALCGATAVAFAQTGPRFYQGTESTATYPLPDSHGGKLIVHAGMPAHVAQYGPPPPFKTLDTNHDGRISEAEARAYPPLDSDFLFASGGANFISRAQYQHWVETQH